MKLLLVGIFCLLISSVSPQAEKLLQNPCVLKQTCHECIQTPSCSWCSDPHFKDNSKRCFQHNQDLGIPCDKDFIYNPDNVYSVLQAKKLTKITQTSGGSSSASEFSSSSSSSSSSFSSSSSSSSGSSHYNDIVQISPQVINLKLRMNEAKRISVDYSQAVAYPVDLYYLMDLSKSMKDDKDKLSSLGNLLAETMKNITSNFRLGFGSFVDKVVMPYVSIVPKKLEEPCGPEEKCVKPFGFKNNMKLSSDTDMFSGEVEKAAVSGNLDAPEGGFDAIMQAVVCRSKIGWREKARRLLVFSTDAGFHYAGDGKLGGIVKPNDGNCHIDEFGHYTHSTIQDYPSVSQINVKVKQNSINVIFAVTRDQHTVYERLSKHIEGSSAGVLSNDSSNIVDLVKDQYDKITQTVEMKDTSSSSAVKVTYYSDCNDPKGELVATNKCDGLKVDSQIRFQVEFVAKSCPPNRNDWKQNFKIYPVGINESLTVQLELLCDCPCENPEHPDYLVEAAQCSNFGTYKCGICECDESHFGRNCECDAQNTKQDENGLGCRPDNTTTIDCSGRGTCTCGQCQCEERSNPLEKITGAFCECDNFSCDRVDGILCSGPEHGTCLCGKCECNPEWSGSDCSCSTRQDTCVPPGGGEVCSGKGTCKCGKCECTTAEEGRYSGRYCEKCPTCPGRCLELKDCVKCQVYKKGPLTEEECANCTFVPSVHEVIEADETKEENLCTYFDEDDCRYTFVYTYDEKGKIVVRAKAEQECPQPVYVLGIVMGVIGAIVLIGLALLLLWKLLTTIHDRREFARFEKERMMAKWETGENPIFKQATSSFKNPTYVGK